MISGISSRIWVISSNSWVRSRFWSAKSDFPKRNIGANTTDEAAPNWRNKFENGFGTELRLGNYVMRIPPDGVFAQAGAWGGVLQAADCSAMRIFHFGGRLGRLAGDYERAFSKM
jgi:hypothetical protein